MIAQAVDDGRGHPLRHVVMRAVAAAAERDVRLWPPAPKLIHDPDPGEIVTQGTMRCRILPKY